MKTAGKVVVMAALMAVAWTSVVSAQGTPAELEGRWCKPTGTWIGQNDTFGNEFLMTIEPMGGGCYSVVSESIDIVPPWETSTAWRGVLRKTGRYTYSWIQVAYAGPSQLTDPGEGVPDIAAIRGVVTMDDCDHFEIDFEEIGLYAWGQVPFEDEPVATLPPFDRALHQSPVRMHGLPRLTDQARRLGRRA